MDLAATLVNQKSDEAMRIAHMVFKADPENIRALDIIIESLEDRKSHGKAEVLKNERIKLLEIVNNQRIPAITFQTQEHPIDLAKTATPDFKLDGIQLENGIDLPINLDLPDKALNISHNNGPLPKGSSDFKYQNYDDQIGNATHLTSDEDVQNKGEPNPFQVQGELGDPTVKITEFFSEENVQAPIVAKSAKPRVLTNPPIAAETDLGIGIELFDYYWRQGFINEAKDLLTQSSSIAGHESWWQARNQLLENSNIGVKVPPQFAGHLDAPAENKTPLVDDAFWSPINESLKLASIEGDLPDSDRRENNGSSQLPNEVIQKIIQVMRVDTGLGEKEKKNMQWELCSCLWFGQ